jgi:hypothetical protein
MANAGFSAPLSGKFPTVAGLRAKESESGDASSLATATNNVGDVVASDVYGETSSPSCTFVVEDTVNLSTIQLGSVTDGIMLTQVVVNTSAGEHPTVQMSGVQVEEGGGAQRTYTLSGTILPRSKAQDIAGAFTETGNMTSCTTTFSVQPHQATVKGVPVASDCSDGRCEVAVTVTDPEGNATLKTAGEFVISSKPTATQPDSDYVSISGTAVKFLQGTEAA